MRDAKLIGVAIVVMFAGCVVSTTEEKEAEEADADIAAFGAAMGEPRADAKGICLLLTHASQRAKEAFCRSQRKLDPVSKEGLLGSGEQRVTGQMGGLLPDHIVSGLT